MQNIRLTLAYDGTRYSGWQRQDNTQNTIQGILSGILCELCGEEVALHGSGRTDAGVHARAQVASFATPSSVIAGLTRNLIYTPDDIKAALNAALPNDIQIHRAEAADPRFHARHSALSKRYIYRIWNRPEGNVFLRKYSCHITTPLDIAAIHGAAAMLVGTHDFRGFSSAGRTKKSTVRTLYAVDIRETDGMVDIAFHGNSFLYNMARILAGTLVECGLGQAEASVIPAVFAQKNARRPALLRRPTGWFWMRCFIKRQETRGKRPDHQHLPYSPPLEGQTPA